MWGCGREVGALVGDLGRKAFLAVVSGHLFYCGLMSFASLMIREFDPDVQRFFARPWC